MTEIPVDLEQLTAKWLPAAKERALQEYRSALAVDRHSWYCTRGRECDGNEHTGYPYKHARGDQWPPPGDDWLIWAVLSGRGCVAPETRIYDPVAGVHIPIADLGKSKPTVETFDGIVHCDDTAYLKGYDGLWDVTLELGYRIRVTADHKFLTRSGWTPLKLIRVGDQIAAGGARPNGIGFTSETVDPGEGSKPSSLHNIHYRSDVTQTGATSPGGNFPQPEWVTIDAIGFSHYGEYWDLTVPGAHHYSAEGIWNHNSGKTRTGSEWMRKISARVPRMGMIGRRGVDIRATLVEGDSGLIRACENAGIGYDWQPSKREFTFPNGSKVFGYSGEEPDSLRGPQHGALWVDEPAHMPLIQDVWDNALLGLRLQGLPGGAKVLVTTTPLPTDWIRALENDPLAKIIRTSTYANLENLDPAFRARIIAKYEGTRLGRQELYGETLQDVIGALWSDLMFQVDDVEFTEMDRIVVGIDPAGTVNKKSDETGLVVAGVRGNGFHVLDDFTAKYSPNGWAERAIRAYQFYQADAIVAEKNYGGDMVRTTIENAAKHMDESVRVIVATATRSKELRAEPIVSLYEQERVWHARGLQALEDEMCKWVPGAGPSPNRIDATVWALTELDRHRGHGEIGVPRGELPIRHAAGRKGPKDLIKGIFA